MERKGRKNNQVRPVRIRKHFVSVADGSVLIEMGRTRVICNATLEEKVPPFLRGKNQGWVTAEYGMLPRATVERTPRESSKGKVGGRTHEIQRLIGRSLRAVVDLTQLGERTVWIDCDVIEADGGTRTASITGAYVALVLALKKAVRLKLLPSLPVTDTLAAISVGIVGGKPMIDLAYEEDSTAEVDMNVVMTGSGRFVELQGTAEGKTFNREELSALLDLAEKGIRDLMAYQKKALGMKRIPTRTA